MERRFINREFEQYLKENADQYRMFPSEQVWENIHHRLHSRRRWYAIGLALLLFTTAAVTSLLFLPAGRRAPVANNSVNGTIASFNSGSVNTAETAEPANKPPASLQRNSVRNQVAAHSVDHHLFPVRPIETGNLVPFRETAFTEETDLITAALSSMKTAMPANAVPAREARPVATLNKPSRTLKASAPRVPSGKPVAAVVLSNPAGNEEKNIPAIAEKKPAVPIVSQLSYSDMPTIESVTGMYKHKKIRKRVEWQIFATPSITYRKLHENKDFLERARTTYNLPTNYSFANINSIVTHKPDIGIQFGFGASYPLTKRIRIVSGLQINVSKYDIRAYNTSSEVATIALSNNYGGANTVSTITNYRNIGGYRADWLHNMYISASAPVGLELNLAGPRKAAFGITGTLQPSYVLGNRAYLLSADFKNYAEVPSLTRKWNLNTGLEVFAGYNTKRLSFRIGPQVRYQVFSSFVKQYPISEHLFDFGVKAAVIVK